MSVSCLRRAGQWHCMLSLLSLAANAFVPFGQVIGLCVCNPHRKMLKNEKETLMSLLFCIEAAEPYEAAMFFCVAEGHVEDGDLEEASVASEGDPIQSQSKLDGQRSRTLNDSEACAC